MFIARTLRTAQPVAKQVFQPSQRLMMTSSSTPGPMEISIRDKLTDLLKPMYLEISNDSHVHRGHAAMVAVGGGSGETHFSVRVVSNEFSGKSTIKRHRLIYEALVPQFDQGLHALSLTTKTPSEAEKLTT